MALGPYLKRIPARSGIYFQRAVPRNLHKTLGKKTWQWKAGNTVAEARRAVQGFLVRTDAEIAAATGAINEGLLTSIDSVPSYGFQQDLQDQGLTPQDLYPRHSPEDAQKLVERQANREQGLPYADRTWEVLLDLCVRLKSPAKSTAFEWKRRVVELQTVTGQTDPTKITADDARRYRDYLLEKVANTTLKTRVRYLRGMYEVAVSEEWLDTNPFHAIKLQFIKGRSKKKKVVRLESVDEKVREEKISSDQQVLYWIMRFTGTHLGEAAGIQYKDSDLKNGVLIITSNKNRSLKSENYAESYRERELPMVNELKEILSGIDMKGKKPNAHVFPKLSPMTDAARWGNGMCWHRDTKLGVSPKACRDYVATKLRESGVEDSVLAAIFGHTPKNSTEMYGTVSMEAKLNALRNLSNE